MQGLFISKKNMKTFKSAKKLIVDRATKLQACSSQLQRAENATILDDLISVCRDNAGWCSSNKLFTDEECISMFGLSLSNLFNSGDSNSGDSNSGNRNSGNWNSGNWNSGDSNSGNWNSGNWNSGNRNSGDSNSGYRNSGAFCTDTSPLMILFNKPCKTMTVKEWEQTRACQLMFNIDPTIWVPGSMMSAEEKTKWPKWETTDGYLKTIPMQEAWTNFWGNLNDKDKSEFTSLENFNAEIFFEITGVRV